MSDKGKELSRDATKAAGVLVVGNVLATAADILMPLLIVRLATKDEVASLGALLFVYNTLALILLAGFHQAVSYFLPTRDIEERAAIVRQIVRTLGMLALIGGGLLVVVGSVGTPVIEAMGWVDDGEATDLGPLAFMLLFPLGDLPARILPNLAVVEGRPRIAATYGVFRSLGVATATIIPFTLDYDAYVVGASLSIFALFQMGFVGRVLRQCYRGVKKVASPVTLRDLVRFSGPLGATDMVSMINSRFDRFLILSNFPAGLNAAYFAGSWQIPVVTRVPYLVATALMPSMVEAFGEGRMREGLAMWRASIGKVSLIVVPVTLVFFVAAEEFIVLAFEDEYVAAAGVFRWYTLLSMLRVAAFGAVIVAAGHPKFLLQAAALSFVSNVVISVPMLIWVGFEGPAIGTVIAFIPTVIFYIHRISQATTIPMREVFPLREYLRVVAVASVGVAAAWVFKSSFDLHPGLMLAGIAVIVLGSFAIVGTVTRTVTREDWAYLTAKLRRRKKA